MKLEHIRIVPNILTSVYGYVEDKYIDIDCNLENLIHTRYYLTIYLEDEDDEIQEEIGRIELIYLDIILAEKNGYGVEDVFDMTSSDVYLAYKHLYDNDETPNMKYISEYVDNAVYVDRFDINKKYRNMGLGSKIMENLPELLSQLLKLYPTYIFLYANPYERTSDENDNEIIEHCRRIDDKNAIEKLIKFYEKNGYKRVENTQYMVRNLYEDC